MQSLPRHLRKGDGSTKGRWGPWRACIGTGVAARIFPKALFRTISFFRAHVRAKDRPRRSRWPWQVPSGGLVAVENRVVEIEGSSPCLTRALAIWFAFFLTSSSSRKVQVLFQGCWAFCRYRRLVLGLCSLLDRWTTIHRLWYSWHQRRYREGCQPYWSLPLFPSQAFSIQWCQLARLELFLVRRFLLGFCRTCSNRS